MKQPEPVEIFSYYADDPRAELKRSMDTALRWQTSWTKAGWKPTILSRWNAAEHHLYRSMRDRLIERSASTELSHAYYRWLAMDQANSDGYFAHIDLLNNGLSPANHCVKNSILCFDKTSDCLVWAKSRTYAEFIAVLMDALANRTPPHPWQVLLSWHGCYIHEEPDLISRNDPSTRLHHRQQNHP